MRNVWINITHGRVHCRLFRQVSKLRSLNEEDERQVNVYLIYLPAQPQWDSRATTNIAKLKQFDTYFQKYTKRHCYKYAIQIAICSFKCQETYQIKRMTQPHNTNITNTLAQKWAENPLLVFAFLCL